MLSGVTRVSDTRGGRKKTVLRCHPWFLLLKTDHLFAHRCHYHYRILLLSLVCHPLQPPGCYPTPFYLSDFVSPLFFVNLPTIFFLRVSPLWRVSPGAVRPPPPSHATGRGRNQDLFRGGGVLPSLTFLPFSLLIHLHSPFPQNLKTEANVVFEFSVIFL